MKNFFSRILSGFMILVLIGVTLGCGTNSNDNVTYYDVSDAVFNGEGELTTDGTIYGDIVFNGIVASRLFKETMTKFPGPLDLYWEKTKVLFIESLTESIGPPRSVRPASFIFYDGFEFVIGSVDDTLLIVSALFTDVSLPEINGATFNSDMTWEDVTALLGKHIQYYSYPDWQYNAPHRSDLISYSILINEIEYFLEFWFYNVGERYGHLRMIVLRLKH